MTDELFEMTAAELFATAPQVPDVWHARSCACLVCVRWRRWMDDTSEDRARIGGDQ